MTSDTCWMLYSYNNSSGWRWPVFMMSGNNVARISTINIKLGKMYKNISEIKKGILNLQNECHLNAFFFSQGCSEWIRNCWNVIKAKPYSAEISPKSEYPTWRYHLCPRFLWKVLKQLKYIKRESVWGIWILPGWKLNFLTSYRWKYTSYFSLPLF